MRTLTSRLYVSTVIAAGGALLLYFAPRELANPLAAGALLGASILLSLYKVRLPVRHGCATLSLAFAVDFAALMLYGVGLAMLLGGVGTLMQCTLGVRRRQPAYRAAFSVAAVTISVWAADATWRQLGGNAAELTVTGTVLPLIPAFAYYVAINAGLVAGAIALTSSVRPAEICGGENAQL